MKTSLNFLKKTMVFLVTSGFLLISGQALAYPDNNGNTQEIGVALNPISANLISKRDKLGDFYDQPSFTFNDAVGIQNTSSTNTIQVSKNSVVGALCQKGQLATDGIGKLLSCESGRFAEASGSGQDTATERSVFNNAKAMKDVTFTSSYRVPENALIKLELLGSDPASGASHAFVLNVNKGGLLQVVSTNRGLAINVYSNGRLIKRIYSSGTYYAFTAINRFNNKATIRLLDAPNLQYNPYRVALGLSPR